MILSNSSSTCYKSTKKIDLTVVAATDEVALTAARSGVDAVYLDVSLDANYIQVCSRPLEKAAILCRYIKRQGCHWYLHLNKIVNEKSLNDVYTLFEWAELHGVAGILVSDLGVLQIAQVYFPHIPIHAGPLLAIHSADGASQFKKMGITRIMLSHELTLDEMLYIASEVPGVEYLVPIHGETCFSSPGLCQCSSYVGKKSARFGSCDQPCRTRWSIDNKRDFYFSKPDICAIGYVNKLIEAGITAMGIQGYSDKPNTIEQLTLTYRTLIDACGTSIYDAIHKGMSKNLKKAISRKGDEHCYDSCRDSNTYPTVSGGSGTYIGRISYATQRKLNIEATENIAIHANDILTIYNTASETYTDIVVEDLRKESDTCYCLISKQYFTPGSPVYLRNPASWNNDIIKNELAGMYRYYTVEEPHGKVLSERHHRRKKFLTDMRANKSGSSKESNDPFVFARFENPEWSLVLDDSEVTYAVFVLNYEYLKDITQLAEKWQNHRNKVIFELPPLIFDRDRDEYKKTISFLVQKQFTMFSINHIAQLPLFEGINATLMSGPDVICLNRQAICLLRSLGITYTTYCLESDYVNLQNLASNQISSALCLTVFFVPVIMRTRMQTNTLPSETELEDTSGKKFIVIHENKNSIIVPTAPVSITHLISRFKSSELAGFIIDLCYISPSSEEWQQLFTAYNESEAITGATQFNFFTKLR